MPVPLQEIVDAADGRMRLGWIRAQPDGFIRGLTRVSPRVKRDCVAIDRESGIGEGEGAPAQTRN